MVARRVTTQIATTPVATAPLTRRGINNLNLVRNPIDLALDRVNTNPTTNATETRRAGTMKGT